MQSAVPVEVEDPADTGETGDLSDPSEELPNPIPSLAFNWGDDPAILWRNYETGENQAWFMDGTETIGSAQLLPMSDWQWRLMGSANFNKDEYPDLLWRNSQTGENQIWLMGENDQGEIISSEIVELVGRDTNWQLRGIGDIDGNGSADILWHDLDYGQNQVWLMNGTQRSFTLNLPHMDDVSWDADSWDMRGTGDFNNDNRPDLIWRNTVTGANQIWLMNGLDCTETVNLEPLDDTNWQLMGSSDLNSDGISDLLWHNMTTGNNQVWLMDNTDQIEVQEVVELRSSDEMTGEMTLQNFFNGETVAQEVVDGEPVETLIPELEGIANLATSVGDGGLNITVDRVDSFGTAVHPLTYAYYDPVGSIHEASTTYRSSVAIRLGDTGERTFLNPNDSTSPDVTSSTPNSIYSEFSYEGLDFSLAQSVNKLFQDGDRTGSVLTQTYTMTNPGSETVNFELVRYIDGDLHFDGSIQDGGGRLLNDGQQILFETDAGGNPLAATMFVGITADGGTELDGNFEIDYWFDLKARILSGETLDNAIAGDGIDEDEFVDEAGEYDLALALGNGFELAPGESQTYTTTTIFGSGSPETSVTENDGSLVLQLADSQTDDTNEQPEGQSLTGSSDSDVLTGAEGNDTLSGVVADADTPGLGEIDTLTGGEGADLFVLGDSARFYYNDGDDAQPGVSDYALIADFDLSEDFIQLYGEPTDYQLGNAPEDLPAGTAIFKTTSGENELMAIVVDNSALSVEDDCFSFV